MSMISRPDFTENQPAIYSQITYAITSDSDQESVDPDRSDEQRDLRFERIVRTNLDRYPLDYDRNQTNIPGKASNANITVDRVEDSSDIGQIKCEKKTDLKLLCNPFDEGKPKVMSYNPFEDDRPTAADSSSADNDKNLENPKVEEPRVEVTGCNPFEEGMSDVLEQVEENTKVADVESSRKEPAVQHRRGKCVRVKDSKDGESKRNAVRQVRQADDSRKVGHVEAPSQMTDTGKVPLAGGTGITHEVKVLEVSNRTDGNNSRQMGVSDDDLDDDLDLPRRTREGWFSHSRFLNS